MECLLVLLFAFVLDLYLGDPVYSLHPVRLMGHAIKAAETVLYREKSFARGRGFLLIVFVQTVFIGFYSVLYSFHFVFFLVVDIFLVYSCIAVKDLLNHAKRVSEALEDNNLSNAQNAGQMLIGRDAKQLNGNGVARATIESLAENLIDGFLAPLFWYTVGCVTGKITGLDPGYCGICLILFYRITNTLDSMVGYKNKKYLYFGRASAKLDDALNFIPARLGILVITLAAFICGLDSKKALIIGIRDRLKHSSPNAGHSEACVAGALNIRLGGPGIYPHGLVEKPWLGDGTSDATIEHLRKASSLILCSSFVTIAIISVPIYFVL
ncbi:adenosylcobinamide-phosphate synthase CbiB [bacterium]|nr:adenosylcobinamide-phosphate synthase CbiB [bacterium]